MVRTFIKTAYYKILLVLPVCIAFVLPLVATAQAAGEKGLGATVGSYVEIVLFKFVNVVFGNIAGLAGSLLDFSINTFVIGFGALFASDGLGYAVNSLWVIMRDFFNLTFIFGLVFIGLKMIFDSSDSGTRKLLVNLILAALLVNFSLFITKFVIDFSNVATVQLVNQFPKDSKGMPSMSSVFVETMGLNTVHKMTAEQFETNFKSGGGFGFIMGQLIVYLVAAYVFLGGALLIMIRMVVLSLYMILSPLMFLGWVFPGLASISQEYWKGFMARCFFAPVYILMLYFSVQIMQSYKILMPTNNAQGVTAAFQTGADLTKTLPPFILTAIFLIASITIAQKMGANGAGGVMALGNTLAGKAKGYAKKGAWASTYVARAPVRWATNATGKTMLKSFNNLQAKTQAAATTPGAGKLVRAANWVATRNATDRVTRGAFEGLKKAQFGTGTTNDQEQEYAQKVQSNINQTQAENNRAKDFTKSENELALNTTSAADLTTALTTLSKTLKSMTKDEKTNLGLAKLKNVHVAANLSDEDIDHFEKSGKFSAQQIQDIKDARKVALTSIAAGGNSFATISSTGAVSYSHPSASTPGIGGAPVSTIGIDQRQNIVSQGSQTVGKLPVTIFTQSEMYKHLTPAMVEERIKKGITPAEKTLMRDALALAMGAGPGALPSSIAAPAPWINQWIKWENSNSFHAANFFS